MIPFTSAYGTAGTHITKQGALVRTWRLSGVTFETESREQLAADSAELNQFIRSIASDRVAIYQHEGQSKQPAPSLYPFFANDYAREVYNEYQSGLSECNTYASELFISIVYRQEPSAIGREADAIGRSVEQLRKQRKRADGELDKIGRKLEASLSMYGPKLLGEYENEQGHLCSEPLEFYNYLLSGYWQPVLKPKNTRLDKYLGSGSVYIGTNVIEIRGKRSKYVSIIEIKEFAGTTSAGVIDAFKYLDLEYMMSASYCGLSFQGAMRKLRTQENHLIATDEVDAAEDVRRLRTALGDDEFNIGEVCINIRISADTMDQVKTDTMDAITALERMGYIAVTSGMATDSAFASALPGNFADRPRISHLTSANFSEWAAMHSISTGKPIGNPWGNAWMPLITESNRINYLNLHEAMNPADITGSLVPACAAIIAKSGAGKTTLLNTICLMGQQYNKDKQPLLSITLDIKEGGRKTIEALHGEYSAVKNGQGTGYNPFQLDDTPDNCLFLDDLVEYLCIQGDGNTVTTADRKKIGRAVRSVMRLERHLRGFAALLQNIASDNDENCIKLRLEKWAREDGAGRVGSHAWALDAVTDTLDFVRNSVFGIDGTDLLENSTIRTPVLMYLLHKIKQTLGTRRVLLLLDEGFQWIADPLIGPWISKTLAQIRSKDGLLIFATQMPSSILESDAGKAIIQQTATFIYSRNPMADWSEYKRLGVNETEFAYITKIQPHNFLIRQGEGSYSGMLNLTGLSEKNMSILAG